MGLFSGPSFPKRAQGEETLFNLGKQMETEAQGRSMSGVRARLSDITDLSDERVRAGRTANADSMQAMAGTDVDVGNTNSLLSRMTKRGSAYSRASLMGDEAVENLGLRSRISMGKFGYGVRSGATRDLTGLVASSDQLNASKMQAQQTSNAGLANMIGTIGGAGLGWGLDKWATKKAAGSAT